MFRSLLLGSLLLLAAVIGHAAPAAPPAALAYPTLEGDRLPAERYTDQVLLINFWATWCPPCVRELPTLGRLQQQFAGQPFRVIAVSVGESSATVTDFLQRFRQRPPLTFLVDSAGNSLQDAELIGLPTSLLIDRKGRTVETISGERVWDSEQWRARIGALLAEEE